jgi:hypothetical protein
VAHLSRQRADRDNQRLVIFSTKDNARVAKNEHLEVRPSAKPADWYIREALQDQHGAYFFDPLVESDNLPRKLVGDLDGYEEPIGTNFGKLKHWKGVMKEIDEVCGTMSILF